MSAGRGPLALTLATDVLLVLHETLLLLALLAPGGMVYAASKTEGRSAPAVDSVYKVELLIQPW